MKHHAVVTAALAAALALSAGTAAAAAVPEKNYPSKFIRIIVPYGAGAGPDVVGRIIGEKLGPALGTNLGYGGPWALPLACYWLARSRRLLGSSFPLVGTNGARDGHDALRMILAGASAVEFCTAVMTGGFGVLSAAVESDSDTVSDIVRELETARTSERCGRLIDFDQAGSMERKKQEGYF